MMERRSRNIILFFEENEDAEVINSRLVRLYMNRFTIEEEQRYDIAGVYNLTPVPLITRNYNGESEKDQKQKNFEKKLCIRKANWTKDQFIIKDAIEKIQLYAQFNIHIFMGTSLYVEVLFMLKKLIQNWRKTIWSQSSTPIF